jgi:hypothetical protein
MVLETELVILEPHFTSAGSIRSFGYHLCEARVWQGRKLPMVDTNCAMACAVALEEGSAL